MNKQPKIGDTIILRAIIRSIDQTDSYNNIKVNFIDCDSPGLYTHSLSVNRIHELIPAPPPLPKVGDTVYRKGRSTLYDSSPQPYTLIHIHQKEGDKRKWGVIAYEGDIPQSVYLEDLKLDPQCAD